MNYTPTNIYQMITDAASAIKSTYQLIIGNLAAKPMFEYVERGDGTPDMPSRQPKLGLTYLGLDNLVPPVLFEYGGRSGEGDLRETGFKLGEPGLESHLI